MKDCNQSNLAAPAAPEAVPDGRSGRCRTGKIARLPHALREELNGRLRDGTPFAGLLPWLNSRTEAHAVLQELFAGSPISEQNLSRWRQGGFVGWLQNQQAREAFLIMSAAGRGLDQDQRAGLTNNLALSVTTRMVAELRQFDETPDGPAKSAAWKQLVWSLVLLRRSEFYAGQRSLEQAKLQERAEKG